MSVGAVNQGHLEGLNFFNHQKIPLAFRNGNIIFTM